MTESKHFDRSKSGVNAISSNQQDNLVEDLSGIENGVIRSERQFEPFEQGEGFIKNKIRPNSEDIFDEIQFTKEVDFHHQIAFRFEKSYRLR